MHVCASMSISTALASSFLLLLLLLKPPGTGVKDTRTPFC